MNKLAITFFAALAIALPAIAAVANGAVDLTGSKEADRAAILKSWAEMDKPAVKATPVAKAAPVVVAKAEVKSEAKKAEAPRPVAKKAVAKRDLTVTCNKETLQVGVDGEQVTFCATVAHRAESKMESRQLVASYSAGSFTVGQ